MGLVADLRVFSGQARQRERHARTGFRDALAQFRIGRLGLSELAGEALIAFDEAMQIAQQLSESSLEYFQFLFHPAMVGRGARRVKRQGCFGRRIRYDIWCFHFDVSLFP